MAWNNNTGGSTQKPKFVHKQNRGSVFDNDHKTTEKHPDFTGTANIAGVVYWVSGWAEMKNGKRMLSLSFKEQEDRPTEPRQTSQGQTRKGW